MIKYAEPCITMCVWPFLADTWSPVIFDNKKIFGFWTWRLKSWKMITLVIDLSRVKSKLIDVVNLEPIWRFNKLFIAQKGTFVKI